MKKLFFLLLTTVLCISLGGQDLKLTADDAAPDDAFGADIDIHGDYIVTGAIWDDDKGTNSGSVYLFRRTENTWVEEAKLTTSNGAAGDWFGASTIRGDYLIACALLNDANGMDSGTAYGFKKNGDTWTQEAMLMPDDGAAGDYFGHRPSLYGDYLVIGSMGDDDNGPESGSAYIFKKAGDTWMQEAKLTPADGSAGAWFGNYTALYDEYAAINAVNDDEERGAVYIFKRSGNTWTQEAKLVASDAAPGDIFGRGIALYEDYLVVSAPQNDANGEDSGAAYVFRRSGDTWTEETKLLPADGAAGDLFGAYVAFDGTYLIIGAEQDDDKGTDSGSAYLFKRDGDTWTQVRKLTADDGMAGARFGHSVGMYQNDIIVGAYGDDDSRGAIYLFDLDSLVPTGTVIPEDPAIHLYPNPADHTVILTYPFEKRIEKVVLYNHEGRVLRILPLRGNSLDVSELPAGIYYIGLSIGKGEVVKKLIVI